MATVRDIRYRDLSAVHVRIARELLAEGDPMEALERGWAAVESELKEAAEARGLAHERHWELQGVVRSLIKEGGDGDMGVLFACVQTMQINFYDVPYEVDEVEWYLDRVERLVGKLGEAGRSVDSETIAL